MLKTSPVQFVEISKGKGTIVRGNPAASKGGNRKQGQRKRRARSRMNEQRHSGAGQRGLADCTRDYALALTNPFDGPLTCVPSAFPPIPTYKVRVWNKGFLSTGTAGSGFLTVNVDRLFQNDGTPVLTSSTAYAGTGFPATTVTAGAINSNTNAPYATAQVNTTALGIQCRVVAAGIRVWYVGPEIDIQGEMLGFRHPDNENVLGLTTVQLLSFQNTRRVRVDSNRTTLDVTWIPMKPRELEFQGDFSASTYNIGVVVSGAASRANIFAYEVFGICEYVGANVPNRTLSSADPAGFAAVLQAAQSEGDTWYGSARDAARYLLQSATSALSTLSGSATARQVASFGARAAMGYLMPNMNVAENLPAITVTELDERAESRDEYFKHEPTNMPIAPLKTEQAPMGPPPPPLSGMPRGPHGHKSFLPDTGGGSTERKVPRVLSPSEIAQLETLLGRSNGGWSPKDVHQ